MSTPELVPVAPLSEYAIIVDRTDNLAIVKKSISHPLKVKLPEGRIVQVAEAVPSGHRFATRPIPEGEFVLQFGGADAQRRPQLGGTKSIRPSDRQW